MREKFAPTNRSRDKTHAYVSANALTMTTYGDVSSRNSRTDSCRIFKLGENVYREGVKRT